MKVWLGGILLIALICGVAKIAGAFDREPEVNKEYPFLVFEDPRLGDHICVGFQGRGGGIDCFVPGVK